MILVDTPVWIDHLHKGVPELAELLESGLVVTHHLVIGELACGQMKNREEFLALLKILPVSLVATSEEVVALIERQRLMGKGLGIVDVHLLASAILTPECRLWTRDRRLIAVADALEVGYPETKSGRS